MERKNKAYKELREELDKTNQRIQDILNKLNKLDIPE